MDVIVNASIVFLRAHATELVWIFGLAVVGRLLLATIAQRIISASDDGDPDRSSGREKRARTLAGLLTATGNVVIAGVVLVMALRLFGVDPMPIIAGAGVIGFGVGFGMQALIRDFISGMFIFAENQFAVGDRVKIGAFEGRVHRMSIRSTVLCDADGNLIFMSNGSVSNVINYSLGQRGKGRRAADHTHTDDAASSGSTAAGA